MKNRHLFYWLILACWFPGTASAQAVLTNGQISFMEISFNNDNANNHANPFWVISINDQTQGLSYIPTPPASAFEPYLFDKPGGARFLIQGPQHLFERPASSEWNFIGIGGGELFRATPQNGDPSTRLIMGISTIGLPNNLFVNNRVNITMSVANVSNPGEFSYYRNDGSSDDAVGILSPPPLFSTVDNITTLTRDTGTLNDFNMAFSHPGLYNVDFQFSATRTAAAGGGTVESLFYRYTFEVAAIPEPATWVLLGVSLIATGGYVWVRRSRRRRLLETVVG